MYAFLACAFKANDCTISSYAYLMKVAIRVLHVLQQNQAAIHLLDILKYNKVALHFLDRLD